MGRCGGYNKLKGREDPREKLGLAANHMLGRTGHPPMKRRASMGDKLATTGLLAAFAFVAVYMLAILAAIGAAIYVALHFIFKFW